MTKEKESRKKSLTLLVNISITLLSLIVSLAALEGILRFKNSAMNNYDIEMWKYSKELKFLSKNPALGHEHKKSASAILQNVNIRINEKGLRGETTPPVTDKRRILFLGSSITLGWGVQEKETLTFRLQEMFKNDGKDVEVLNVGIGNYNTVRYVERFLTRLKDLEPTDIVVHYFINDAEELKAGGGNILLRNSQLAVTLWSIIQLKIAVAKGVSLENHYKSTYKPDFTGYMEMRKALKRLSAYAQEKKIRLYLAMMPDVHNLTNYKFGYIHENLKKISGEHNYRFLDLLPSFSGLTPEEVWSMPGDPHPNELGHKIIAEALYPTLTDI